MKKKGLVVALDVGGTKIVGGLVEGRGRILRRIRAPSGALGRRSVILGNILAAVRGLMDGRVSAIGVGIAGQVDHERGVFRRGPHFSSSFRNVPLREILRKEFRLPVVVDNDAHCFALAEALRGAGAGARTVAGITLGTGIGGGIVVDGRVLHGAFGTAGEFGHTFLGRNRACDCGQRGHFEALISGSAIERAYRRKTGRVLRATDIEREALRGARPASLIFRAAAEELARGLANIIAVVNPDVIVIGGGLVRARFLWRPAARSVKKFLFDPALSRTTIVPSRFGDDAPVIGAALLAQK